MSTPRMKPALKRTVLRATAKEPGAIAAEIRQMIQAAHHQVAQVVNAGLTMPYWQIGRRIHREILNEKRAEYGAEIVSALGRQLAPEFGRGFGVRNLFRMVRFAEVFLDRQIVSALMTQLGWTHFTLSIPIQAPTKRDFCAEMCRVERWSSGGTRLGS